MAINYFGRKVHANYTRWLSRRLEKSCPQAGYKKARVCKKKKTGRGWLNELETSILIFLKGQKFLPAEHSREMKKKALASYLLSPPKNVNRTVKKRVCSVLFYVTLDG